MASRAELVIDIVVNSAKGAAGLDQASGKVGKFQKGLNKMVAPAAAAATALIAIGAASVKSASDLQQSFGGLDAVFGDNSQQMKDWAGTAAQTMGLSASAYAEGAAKIGAQMKNLGVPMDQVAGKTNDLMTTAADLAATYGGTTQEAVDALGAALRGEADPAERYGLALSQTAISAKMAADGTDKLTGKAKQQAKITATLGMITEQAGGAVGQFAREQDSAAGASQIAAAQFENAKAALGTALLPIVSQVATQMAKMATFVQENATVFQVLAVVVGVLSAAILIMAAAQWVMNLAMLAFPGTWIALAIIAVIVAIVLLWNKCDAFRAFILNIWAVWKMVWAGIVAVVKAAVAGIVAAWTAIVAGVTAAVAWVKAAWASVGAFFVSLWNAIVAAAQLAWNMIVSVVTAVITRIVALAKVFLTPYVLAFQLIAAVASLAFQLVRLAIQLVLAGAIITANRIRTLFIAAWNAIKSAASSAWSAVRSVIMAIAAPVIAVANRIKAAFVAAFNAVKSAARTAATGIRAAIAAIAAPIIAVINRIKAAFTAGLNAMKSAASSAASAIKSKLTAIAAPIIAVANRIKSAFTSALNAIKSAASAAGGALKGAFSGIAGAINNAISAVRRLISALRSIKVPSIKLPSLGGASSRSAGSPSGMSTRAPGDELSLLRAGTFAGNGSVGGMINITVNGALDPEAVARQIERVLSGAGRRRSGVTLRQRAGSVAAPV